jgi:putative ABC transport system permease protein
MAAVLDDLRYAWRMLLKSPGFTAVAVLTLTLGIGANTAVFSVVDTVLLDPLPYASPEQLVLVSETLPLQGPDELGVSAAEYFDYRNRNRSFSEVAAYEREGFNLTGQGTPVRVNAARVTSSAFALTGVKASLGRTFTAAEDRDGAEHVVLLSRALWEHHFAGNPAVLGKTLKLDENPYTIVGVMPASFRFPFDGAPASERADIWVPEAFSADRLRDRVRDFGVGLVARLKPGVGLGPAQQDVSGVAAAFMKDYPEHYSGTVRVAPTARPWAAYTAGKTRPLVFLLMAAVASLLLIACANVANLLLARSHHRSREMAIRSALGARRTQLLRQCLVESSLLSLLGAGSGIALAALLVEGLRKFGPSSLPRLQEVSLHPVALVFTVLLSLGTSVFFGFLPAWRLSQVSPEVCLKETGQIGATRKAHRMQSLVAVAEIAAALVLLIGSTLLVKSFLRVLNAPLGFEPEGALVVRTLFDRSRYPDPLQRNAAQKQLLENLSHLPGVTAVAAASHLPLSDERQIGFRLERAAPDDFHWAANSLVSPGFFRAMGMALLGGRDFDSSDRRDAPNVAIVNETMAKQYFPNQNPLGQRFQWGDRALFEVIGVVADVRISALDAEPPPMIYNSMFQVESGASGRTALVLRSGRSDDAAQQGMFRAVQDQVWSLDKDLPLYKHTTLASLISESLAQRRFTTLLMTGFAGVALVLAVIGLFGVVSFLVASRTREVAVRVALGASRPRILWLILGEGAALGLAGCFLGLGLFGALSGLFVSQLYRLSAFDPATLAVAPVALLGVTVLSAYVPARRAMRVDPIVALRYQ